MDETKLNFFESFGSADHGDLVAEIRLLRLENAELRAALNAEHHVVVFSDRGWGLEHSIDCRRAQTMVTCEFNKAIEDFVEVLTPALQLELQRVRRWVLAFDQDDGDIKLVPDWKGIE